MKNSVPNIWMAQENLLRFYKLLSIGLGLLAVIFLGFAVGLYFQNPIVVVSDRSGNRYTMGKRAPVSLDQNDIKKFTRNFIRSVYAWKTFDPESLNGAIAPFCSPNLVQKVIRGEAQKYLKAFSGRKAREAVAFIEVKVNSDSVVAQFDRILEVAGIPVVIHSQVILSMIKGPPTQYNPMGIYVTGVDEHDG